MTGDRGWSPARATDVIRRIARDARLSLAYKVHAAKREAERGITVSDVLHVLRHGFVHQPAVAATRPGFFKYQIECVTPNSEGRTVALIVIPDPQTITIKIVTIMWKDEESRRAGTLAG